MNSKMSYSTVKNALCKRQCSLRKSRKKAQQHQKPTHCTSEGHPHTFKPTWLVKNDSHTYPSLNSLLNLPVKNHTCVAPHPTPCSCSPHRLSPTQALVWTVVWGQPQQHHPQLPLPHCHHPACSTGVFLFITTRLRHLLRIHPPPYTTTYPHAPLPHPPAQDPPSPLLVVTAFALHLASASRSK